MRISPDYLVQFDEPDTYLDFGRFGPPSHAVLDTTAQLLKRATRAGSSTVDELMRQEQRAKAAAARLAGSDTDRVVLVPNTSAGLFQAAFNSSGEVLVSPSEFPANTYPWARAEQAGRLVVRSLGAGHVTPALVADALTPDISVVSVSAVDFRTGYRADLGGIREAIGDRLLVVDAVQGFGVIEAPWEAADVLVVGGQKWLRAGWGAGFVVLSDRALERMDPVLSGWTGARDPGLFDDEIHPAESTAASWSITNLSPVTSGAFAAALELVEEAGVAAIAARIAERVGELEEVVLSLGGTVVSAVDRRAGILAFTLPDFPAEAVGAALTGDGIACTARPQHVRLSPHASTTAGAAVLVRSALAGLSRPVAHSVSFEASEASYGLLTASGDVPAGCRQPAAVLDRAGGGEGRDSGRADEEGAQGVSS